MKVPGMMLGKIFKGTNPEKEGVTYGPNVEKAPPHPLDVLAEKMIGNSESFYEPTGHIKCDPDKIEYLKS